MFLGKYFCGLDKENGFIPPDGYKANIFAGVYITQGFDQNLWVLSHDAFQEIYKKLGTLNLTDPMARLLFRLLLGAATEAGVNEQGYLNIPDNLRNYALLEDKALLIGQGDYFEIWSPDLWEKQEDELRKMELNAERFSIFEITTR